MYPYLHVSDFEPGLPDKARRLIRAMTPKHPWLPLSDEELLHKAGFWRNDPLTGREGYTLAARDSCSGSKYLPCTPRAPSPSSLKETPLSGRNRRTIVYDRDVAQAAVLVVSHPAAAGRVFNVTDGTFHTLNEIIESICFVLGRKPPRLSLPVGPIRTLIRLIEKGCNAIGLKPPVTRETVDSSLIQKELGFVPQYDLKTGWEETVGEMPR